MTNSLSERATHSIETLIEPKLFHPSTATFIQAEIAARLEETTDPDETNAFIKNILNNLLTGPENLKLDQAIIKQIQTPGRIDLKFLAKKEHLQRSPFIMSQLIKDAEMMLEKAIQTPDQIDLPQFLNQMLDALTDMETLLGANIWFYYVDTSNKSIYNSVRPPFKTFEDKLSNSTEWYKILKRMEQCQELTSTQAAIVKTLIKQAEANGVHLNDTDKQKLEKVNAKIAEEALLYKTVIGDHEKLLHDSNELFLRFSDSSTLKALPPQELEKAATTAQEKGWEGFAFEISNKLSANWSLVQRYCSDPQKRAEATKIRSRIGTEGEYDVRHIFAKQINLRQQKAEIMGYASFGDLKLSTNLMESPETVNGFIKTAAKKVSPAILEHQQRVKEFSGLGDAYTINDYTYYNRLLQEGQSTDFDINIQREHFEMGHCIKTVFQLVEDHFGLRFEALDIDSYHPDLKAYQVVDVETNQTIGYINHDPFYRESKINGQWNVVLRHLNKLNDVEKLPASSISQKIKQCKPNEKQYLSFADLRTFMHELGHALHFLHVELINTMKQGDALELASMTLEQWAYNEEFLKSIAINHKTGEKMSDELINICANQKQLPSGLSRKAYLLVLGGLGIQLHNGQRIETAEDVEAIANKVLQDFPPDPSLFPDFIARVLHLTLDDYSAGLYLYALGDYIGELSYSALTNPNSTPAETGRKYRETMLQSASFHSTAAAFKKFTGYTIPEALDKI